MLTNDDDPRLPANAPTITRDGHAERSEAVPAAAIPGYDIEGELGRGGMGVVYRAREASLNRTVALKVLLSGVHAGERELSRFRAEAESAAAIQHPNVVHVYAIGQHAGFPYMALEFVPGGTLADRLSAGPLDPRTAATLVRGIARGVQAAHDRGVIHRDLKPANVLFDITGEPKVADFGLAKRDDSGLTASGAIMGTPAYMAPEQARGDTKKISASTDVWAVGAILYECLTGVQPFRGESAIETLRRVCESDPPPLPKAVPKDLATIVNKCLQRSPSDRYASAGQLADDLGRYLAGESIIARPPSPSLRAARWIRSHSRLAYLAAGAVMATIVAIVLYSPGSKPQPRPKRGGEAAPSAFAWIPPDAFAVVSIRPDDIVNRPELYQVVAALVSRSPEPLDPRTLAEDIEKAIGLRPEAFERVSIAALDRRVFRDPAADQIAMYFRTKDPPDFAAMQERLEAFFGSFERGVHQGQKYFRTTLGKGGPMAIWRPTERDFVFAPEPVVQAAIERLEKPAGHNAHIAELEKLANEHSLIATARSFEPLLTILQFEQSPDLLNAAAALNAVESLTAALDVLPATADNAMPGVNLRVRARFSETQAARQSAISLQKAFKNGGRQFETLDREGLAALAPGVRDAIRGAKIEAIDSDMTIAVEARWSADSLKRLREKPRLSIEKKLMLIGLAIHNYQSVYDHLPLPNTLAADGKPLHSWRVAILPYMEQDELYRRFKQKSAWDDPDNKQLLDEMPEIFQMEADDPAFAKNRTRFQVIQAKGGMFNGANKMSLSKILDGTADTLMVVEAGEPIEWTAPDTLRMDEKGPVPKLGNPKKPYAWVLRGDGSYLKIQREPPLKQFWPIVTASGADDVNWTRLSNFGK